MRKPLEALGHRFRPFKSCEMICRRCDFVIGEVENEWEAMDAVRALGGKWCPGTFGLTSSVETEHREHPMTDPEGEMR